MSLRDELRRWLEEDAGSGDVTSQAVVPEGTKASAVLLAKEAGVLCGADLISDFAGLSDGRIHVKSALPDGAGISPGTVAASIEGDARAILLVERTWLNLVQRLSGIATLTSRFVEAVSGTRARILDTRKTAPGLRELEKRAVRAGGGSNHRMGLFDQFLIKENHLACLGGGHGAFASAIRRARAFRPGAFLVIEVSNVEECLAALESGPDVILLDNMAHAAMREAVRLVELSGRAVELEASGGVSLKNARVVAETGVHRISVGAITHSAAALDLSLEFGVR